MSESDKVFDSAPSFLGTRTAEPHKGARRFPIPNAWWAEFDRALSAALIQGRSPRVAEEFAIGAAESRHPGGRHGRKVVAYCKNGAACGNPYEGGKLYYAEGYFVDGCPRCGGPITHNREYVNG